MTKAFRFDPVKVETSVNEANSDFGNNRIAQRLSKS